VLPTLSVRVLREDGRTLHPWYLQQALRRAGSDNPARIHRCESCDAERERPAGARLLRRWWVWRILTRRPWRAS